MSTFLSLHYHIIFSTKYRKPWIGDAWINRFHEYIGGTIRGLDVHETIKEPRFNWQEGYAGFTVSPTSRNGVKTYIGRQAEHHRRQTFQEELIDLLQKAGVEFDPKYLD